VEVARLQLFFDDLFLFRRQVDIHRLRLHWLHYVYDTSVATSVTSLTQSIGTAGHQNFWPLRHLIGAEKGELRTPKYENRKSCFFLCLEFRFSEQNGEIQPEKVTRKIAEKKVCIINHLYFLAERGGFEPPLGCLFPKTV
jgi:hypothetical protein